MMQALCRGRRPSELQFGEYYQFDRDDVPEFLARDVAPQVADLSIGSHT